MIYCQSSKSGAGFAYGLLEREVALSSALKGYPTGLMIRWLSSPTEVVHLELCLEGIYARLVRGSGEQEAACSSPSLLCFEILEKT